MPVLNLDTGEKLTLSEAEDKLPQGINPLSLHIMRLTAEYVSNSNLHKRKESDEESVDSKKSLPRANEDYDRDSVTLIKRKAKFKQFLDYTVRKTVSRAKIIAQEVSHVRHKDEITDIKDEVSAQQQSEPFKLRASNNHKGPYEFQSLEYVQVRDLFILLNDINIKYIHSLLPNARNYHRFVLIDGLFDKTLLKKYI